MATKGTLKRLRVGEDLVMRLMPRKDREGSTAFGRLGDVVQQPPVWAGLTAILALRPGRSRRAAWRGAVCYGLAAVVGNLVIKPVVRRSRPPGSGKGRKGPVTSSFPSGHAAADLAFALGAAQEIPLLFLPMAGTTMAAHWSLVRSRGHYPSDVLVGGVVGVVVAVAVWRLWPPGEPDGNQNAPSGVESEELRRAQATNA